MATACDDDKGKALKDHLAQHHRVLIEAMRAREGEILKFLGIMLPALGGFAWLLTRTPDNVPLLGVVVGVLCVQFVLWWGGRYALALSYNYRCLQAQIKKFEIFIETDQAMLKKWQGMPKPIDNDMEFPPEIFKTQLTAFLVGQVLVSAGGVFFVLTSFFFPCNGARCACYWPVLGVAFLGMLCIVLIAELLWRRHQLRDKHRDLLDAESRGEGPQADKIGGAQSD